MLSPEYVAGFFDGEGSLTITRNSARGESRYFKIIATLTQRARYRRVLDEVCEQYGGAVVLKKQTNEKWAITATWQLQSARDIEHFLNAIEPFVVVKREQVRIALDFLRNRELAQPVRDALGRVHGRAVSNIEHDRREGLRLEMREANQLGPIAGE